MHCIRAPESRARNYFALSIIDNVTWNRQARGAAVHVDDFNVDAQLSSCLLRVTACNSMRVRVICTHLVVGSSVFASSIICVNTPRLIVRNLPRFMAVPTTGWCQLSNEYWVFVLPHKTKFPADLPPGELATFQTDQIYFEHGFAVEGSKEEWAEKIALPFAGNSIVTLAVGSALAGPLTVWAGVPPGIFHTFCGSKRGKSLASAIGQSIYGRSLIPNEPSPIRWWRGEERNMTNDVTKSRSSSLTTKKSEHDAGSEIDAFLKRARALHPGSMQRRGRLIFGLDATGSRQATWDMAMSLQTEMFQAVSNLDVSLVFFRGIDECRASAWVSSGERLANLMTRITCQYGRTQIGRVLAHAQREAQKANVHGLVFVGDAMEENLDELAAAAAELGCRGVKAFMFQEGADAKVEHAFREIAKLTGGAYCRFDAGSARQLAELLRAVAVYAAGGVKALSASGNAAALKLLQQLGG